MAPLVILFIAPPDYTIMLSNGKNRVQSRLLRVFVIQLILISFVTVLTVLAASFIAENLLVKKALEGEAGFYWKNRQNDPDFPLAASLNLTGYLSSNRQSPPPKQVVGLPLGQHYIDFGNNRKIVHVSEQNEEKLYLFFDGVTVGKLALTFGILPLIIVLLTMYGLSFLTYLLSKRAVSPISKLANFIENIDFSDPVVEDLDLKGLAGAKDSETEILVDALDHFVTRSRDSIERERNFTRYASHELRTPLAVIQGSTSSLELLQLDGAGGRAVGRIKRTCKQMGDLLNTLLLLARDRIDNEISTEIEVNELVERLVAQSASIYQEKNIDVSVVHKDALKVSAPESVLVIVIGNIIENAFSYTESGAIRVEIDQRRIRVSDTGRGMDVAVQKRILEPFFRADDIAYSANSDDDSEQRHQGLGLAIVQKTCSNYDWSLGIESITGKGSVFEVDFNQPDH